MTRDQRAEYGYDLYLRSNGDIDRVERTFGRLSDRMKQHYADLAAEGRRFYVPMNKFSYGIA